MRFVARAVEEKAFPVTALCRALDLSRSSVYAQRKRVASKRVVDDRRLAVLIRSSFDESRQTYGSPRVHDDLRDQGERVSRKRVIRLMQASGLRARVPRRRVRTTDSNHALPVVPNLLAREFRTERPNEGWVTDITYLRTPEGWLYLAVVLDLYSRFVVGWATSTTIDRQLALDALTSARLRRKPKPGLLHHSDRGTQYASEDYQNALDEAGMIGSMSGRGNCYDNAVAESFFSTLKQELGEDFDSHAYARRELFDYIEVFYNQRRKHSTLGYKSPAQFERINQPATVAV